RQEWSVSTGDRILFRIPVGGAHCALQGGCQLRRLCSTRHEVGWPSCDRDAQGSSNDPGGVKDSRRIEVPLLGPKLLAQLARSGPAGLHDSFQSESVGNGLSGIHVRKPRARIDLALKWFGISRPSFLFDFSSASHFSVIICVDVSGIPSLEVCAESLWHAQCE